jgi:hypothetical protein
MSERRVRIVHVVNYFGVSKEKSAAVSGDQGVCRCDHAVSPFAVDKPLGALVGTVAVAAPNSTNAIITHH